MNGNWDSDAPNPMDSLKDTLNQLKRSAPMLLGIGGLLLLLLAAFTAMVRVEPAEEGVVLRFGKYTRTVGPGLHFIAPFGIEHAEIVPVRRMQTEEFGLRTHSSVDTFFGRAVRSEPARKVEDESLMLTGDLNLVDVEWVIQYNIKDAKDYLFNVQNVQSTLRALSETVARQLVGNRAVHEVLTVGRDVLQQSFQKDLQALLDEFKTGVNVLEVRLQNVVPPRPVQPAFDEVNEAEQQKSRLQNEAEAAYNRTIPRTRGQKEKMIAEAQGYKLERINRAHGDVARYLALLEQYGRAPDVTRTRLYLETMEKILPKLQRVYITGPDGSILKLLDLKEGGRK